MKDDEKINYSDLARRYGLKDVKLGNMVVREYLENEGINVQQFHSIAEVPQNQGAGSRKCLEGTYLFLCPEKNEDIKKSLKDKLDVGEYVIGELVVPKRYRKYVLKSDGTLQEVEFTVSARKIPLAEIRKREL
ncbi:hypothetical protein ABFA07_014264 [Porites harrisoni]